MKKIKILFLITFLFSSILTFSNELNKVIENEVPARREMLQNEIMNKDIVILKFFKSTWPYCLDEVSSISDFKMKNPNVAVIFVANSKNAMSEQKFAKESQLDQMFHIVYDPIQVLTKNFNIVAVPSAVILDKNGKILGVSRGKKDWNNITVDMLKKGKFSQ